MVARGLTGTRYQSNPVPWGGKHRVGRNSDFGDDSGLATVSSLDICYCNQDANRAIRARVFQKKLTNTYDNWICV